MEFGYARVSKKEQKLDRHIDALRLYGIHKANIYMEKESGKNRERPQLKKLLDIVEAGDRIVTTELTRLGRSTRELITLSETLNKKGVELISLKEKIDTTTATGKMIFGVFAVLAQFERELIIERTKDGLEAARARGKQGGRPKVNTDTIERALTLYDMTPRMSIKDICTMSGISKPTLYKYVEIRKKERKELKL